MFQSLLGFLVPGGLILLVAVGFLRPHGLPGELAQLLAAFPYLVYAAGFFFGWYFSSARTIFSLLIVFLADQGLSFFPTFDVNSSSQYSALFAISTLLVPLNILAFSLVNDEALFTLKGGLRLLPVLIQPFLVLWLCDPEQEVFTIVFRQVYVPWLTLVWTPLPQAAVGAFAAAGVLSLIRYALRGDSTDSGAFWSLAAIFLAYHGTQFHWHPTNFFSTAGLILFVSMTQSAYRRTYRDELTGVEGRLAYEEAVAQIGRRFAVAVLSIDQLKICRGTHGNDVAEQILKILAQKIRAVCHRGRVFRVSGEELTIIFNHRTAIETIAELELMRKTIEMTDLIIRKKIRVWERAQGAPIRKGIDEPFPVTAAIGVAEKNTDSETFHSVMKAAYRALYDAKGTGGNAVKRGAVSRNVPKRLRQEHGSVVVNAEF